ncbi:VOC family protein [Ewingella sp. S1.OA.A_B6]
MSGSTANLLSCSFVLAVPDLKKSAAYFRDVLGFSLAWPEDLGWQMASRGAVRIMMGHSPDAIPPSETGDHSYFGYLNVDDANALYHEFVSSGAIILQPPADQPHGMREFTVATPEGHRMMIGQDLSSNG